MTKMRTHVCDAHVQAMLRECRSDAVVGDASYRASRMVRDVAGQVPIIDDRVRVYRTRELFTEQGEGEGKWQCVVQQRARDSEHSGGSRVKESKGKKNEEKPYVLK